MYIRSFLFPVLIVVSLAQGCSFSESSASSSDSSNSSSESSGSLFNSSSSSDDHNAQYQNAILNYTTAYINSSKFNRFAFTRGISEIASAHGITHWEDDEETLIAIGRGLKNTNLSNSLYEIYKNRIANAKADRIQLIQKGYDM